MTQRPTPSAAAFPEPVSHYDLTGKRARQLQQLADAGGLDHLADDTTKRVLPGTETFPEVGSSGDAEPSTRLYGAVEPARQIAPRLPWPGQREPVRCRPGAGSERDHQTVYTMTLDDVAEHLDVSTRTVRRRMRWPEGRPGKLPDVPYYEPLATGGSRPLFDSRWLENARTSMSQTAVLAV